MPFAAAWLAIWPFDQRRAHEARADGVNGDAVGPGLQRDGLSESYEAVLGGNIGGLVRAGNEAVYRRDVDYAAPLPLLHAREQPLRELEGRDEHHLEEARPRPVVVVLYGGHLLEPGVVDQDVHTAAELGWRARPARRPRPCWRGRPAGSRRRSPRRPPRPAVAQVADNDTHSRTGQRAGDCPAYAAGGACNECGLVCSQLLSSKALRGYAPIVQL